MKKWFKRILYLLATLFVLFNILIAMQAYHATRFYDSSTGTTVKRRLSDMSTGEKLNAALFGVKVPKRAMVDTLAVPHTSITLKTEDGLTLAGWYAVNKGTAAATAKGTIIMFHGHADCRNGIIKEAEAFYAMGYSLLMVDFRAHGQSSGNTCTIGYEEAKDVKAAYDYVVAAGEKNIVLWGISLGASTIIKAVHDYTLKPSKVILEMPFGSLFDAVKGFTRINHVPEEPIAALLTFWGGAEHGFWAFGMKPQEYARSLQCPVLLQRGENDIRVTESETQEIYNNITVADKTLVEYANCGHQSLYRKDSVKWVQTVTRFLGNR
jgi:alpha-beta hydrolase superfamily lysophospholipase